MKGIAHVGALEAFEERGLLRFVKEVVGTSAGAMMALCLAAGYTVAELKALCLGFDFTLMQSLEPESMLALPDTFGLDSGANLDKLLRTLLRAKGLDPDITFSGLSAAAKGPALRVYAVDIEACLPKAFSAATTPDTPVATAVTASMSIPFYVVPVTDPGTGRRLVDGGIIAHFPFHHLTDEEREETVGFVFSSNHKYAAVPATNLLSFILQLYYSVYHHQNKRLYESWGHRILTIPCGGYPSLAFESDREQKEALIAAGRTGAEEFLRQPGGRRPRRRHSF